MLEHWNSVCAQRRRCVGASPYVRLGGTVLDKVLLDCVTGWLRSKIVILIKIISDRMKYFFQQSILGTMNLYAKNYKKELLEIAARSLRIAFTTCYRI